MDQTSHTELHSWCLADGSEPAGRGLDSAQGFHGPIDSVLQETVVNTCVEASSPSDAAMFDSLSGQHNRLPGASTAWS